MEAVKEMKMEIAETAGKLGIAAAEQAAGIINDCVAKRGLARIVLSTGASQFTFLEALALCKIDWSKVEMFHLDEYVGLPVTHPASFRKYLQERFLSYAVGAKAHLVNGEKDIANHIAELTRDIRRAPIDLSLIGIGENAHIAFNDPPADFDTIEAYKVVELDDACKMQQVREGWFESMDKVPKQAITMTVRQILDSATIISCVPYQVKANAVEQSLKDGVSEQVPASILKTHKDWRLFLDQESASGLQIS
jgi:glucosamine-6-phosphate deaminase